MTEKFGVIVAGAGIAGLSAALGASMKKGASVAVADWSGGSASNTALAQGGIASAIGKTDSWKKHYTDTIAAGCGLCDTQAAELAIRKGPAAIRELMELGLRFDGGNEAPELGLEGGHSENRVLHINGDGTGRGLASFLRKIVSEQKNVHFLERAFLEAVVVRGGRCIGAQFIGEESAVACNALVLATGGYAACWRKTTNPVNTTGSGIGAALAAGCEAAGMEFVQFHPTTLASAAGKNFLVSEAVRGEGGKIVDSDGRQVIGPLETRDRVSAAIYSAAMQGKKAYLDATGISAEHFRKRFPSVHAELLGNGIDPGKDLIPIEVAAHYTIGGIRTGTDAETSVKGVFAAGECAFTGMHGANRLASNSLLEGLVMGRVAGENAAKAKNAADRPAEGTFKEKDGAPPRQSMEQLREVMWHNCGVTRTQELLAEGLAKITSLQKKAEFRRDPASIAAACALTVSRKTVEAALARRESVGTHIRLD